MERKVSINEDFMHHMLDEEETYEIKTVETDINSSLVC